MDFDDNIFNPTGVNDFEKEIQDFKSFDKGYNKIYKGVVVLGKNGEKNKKKKKIEFYTSGYRGTRIRDAITGSYYNTKVGSFNENKYFKVSLATGQCNSKNGSHMLFYQTPQQYMNHFGVQLNPAIIEKWDSEFV
jgi:hypothetical protein